MYRYNQHPVTLQTLIDFAWSAPMRDLAERLTLSDVGLKKIFKSHGVTCPPQGHWNKLRAGRPVTKPPKAPARRPGERGYILVDARFQELPRAEPLPTDGPFTSVYVPENLDELRSQELAAIGKAASARQPAKYHSDLAALIKQDEIIAAKPADRWGLRETPKYTSPFERRRFRILNAIFLTLSRRGHDGRVDQYKGHLSFKVIVGDTGAALELEEKGRRPSSQYEQLRNDVTRSADVTLALSVRSFDGSLVEQWEDDRTGKLETKIAAIAADLIVAGEQIFREGLKRDAERAAQMRLLQIERDAEAQREADAKRVAALLRSGELLLQAERLRQIIRSVEVSIAEGDVNVAAADLARWRAWATEQADKLDPIKSGQVFEHLPKRADSDAS